MLADPNEHDDVVDQHPDIVAEMYARIQAHQTTAFSPDRGHVHHRLLDMGMTQRRVVLGLYGISILLTGVGMLVAFERNRIVGVVIIGAAVIALLLWGLSFGRRKREEVVARRSQPDPESR